MTVRRVSGISGMIAGAIWFSHNWQFFAEQGLVPIGMPIVIFIGGLIYFINRGKKAESK